MPVVIFVPTEFEAKGIFGEITSFEGFKAVAFNGEHAILTGVGKTNAALTTARYFHKFPPHAGTVPIIVGTAGAYIGTPLKIGEVVVVKKTYFADEGIVTGKELKLSSEIGFSVCEGNVLECRTVDLGYKICDENTVSLISGTREMSDYYYNKTGAWVESMEGAAFEQAAEIFGLKSVQLRAVSNPTADPEFVLHTKDAFKNLREAVTRLMAMFN